MAVGAIIAAAVAVAGLIANEVRSSNAASDAEDETERRRQQARKDQEVDFWTRRAEQHGKDMSGFRLTNNLTSVDQGADRAKEGIQRQRDQQSSGNWTNAGMQVASIGANVANNWDSYFPSQQEAAFQGFDNDSLAQRAPQMSLSAGDYGILSDTPPQQHVPIQPTDPSGGFQLQEGDYRTLAGAGGFAAGPYADDEWATAPGYNDPNRYRYRL